MLGWAERQLETLKTDHAAFLRKKPYGLWGEEYEAGGEKFAAIHISVAWWLSPIPNLIFRVGDILHNMRVSLDYLAFAVARKRFPAIVEKANRKTLFQVAFPVCAKVEDWGPLKGKMLMEKWASEPAIRIFEALQPYNRPMLANLDPLLLLHRLDNPHKHRNLLAAAPAISGVEAIATDPLGHFDPVWFGCDPCFQDGAVVARYKRIPVAKSEGQPKAKMETQVGFEIAFDEKGPAPMHPVFELLDAISYFSRNVIFPTLEPHT